MTLTRKLIASTITMALCAKMAYAVPHQTAPQLNLFPTAVVEHVAESYDAAGQLQASVNTAIQQLSQQRENYEAAQCENHQGDAGCDRLQQAMVAPFEELLEEMNHNIPALEQSMQKLQGGLGNALMRNVGRSMTAKQLQDIVEGRRAERRGKTRQGLASTLKSLNDALAMGDSNSSQPAFAAEIYLDTGAALGELAMLQDNIAYLLATSKVRQAMGGLSDNDLNTLSSVKALLYGTDNGCTGDCLPEPLAMEATDSNIQYLRSGE